MSCAWWTLNSLSILNYLLPHVLGLDRSSLLTFSPCRLWKRAVLLRHLAYMIAPTHQFCLELFLRWKNYLVPAEFVTPFYRQPINLVFHCFRHLFHQFIPLNLALRNLAIGVNRFRVEYGGLVVSILLLFIIRTHQGLAVAIGVVSNWNELFRKTDFLKHWLTLHKRPWFFILRVLWKCL